MKFIFKVKRLIEIDQAFFKRYDRAMKSWRSKEQWKEKAAILIN